MRTAIILSIILVSGLCFAKTIEEVDLEWKASPDIQLKKPLEKDNVLECIKHPIARAALKSYLNECRVSQTKSLYLRTRLNATGLSDIYQTKFDILKELVERDFTRVLKKSNYTVHKNELQKYPLLSINIGVVAYNLNNSTYCVLSLEIRLSKLLKDLDTGCEIEAAVWETRYGNVVQFDDNVEHPIKQMSDYAIEYFIESMENNRKSIRTATDLAKEGIDMLEIRR